MKMAERDNVDQPEKQAEDLEYRKWIYELKREDAKRAHDLHLASIESITKFAVENGNLAIRMAMLINGGAALSLLAFIGSVAKDHIGDNKLLPVAASLTWFALGVFASAFAMGFAYLTNSLYAAAANRHQRTWDPPYVQETTSSKSWMRVCIIFQWMTILLSITCLIFFIIGMFDVRSAISALFA